MNTNSILRGKKALVLGVANERSLGWSIAKHLHQQGAEVGFTYIKSLEKWVIPLANSLNATLIEPCDVTQDNQIEALFQKVKEQWKSLDILIHSIAFANVEELQGRFINITREGFKTALDISTYSLIALSRHAEALLEKNGGSIITLTYYGSQKVIPNYNIMGVAKAGLESCVRYLAYDLGPKKIRVNAISAGPIKTLASRGIKDFNSLMTAGEKQFPLQENVQSEDIGALAAFLCSPSGVHITGSTLYVDSGAHIMGSISN